MLQKRLYNFLYWSSFTIFLVFFCYFRLIPLYYQTVPYTYDQGRDFMRVMEFVQNRQMPFIGPTTGISGVFHGAWWYYFLALPYLFFRGNPIGFYYSIFFIFLVSAIAFTFFLRKEFGRLVALLFFAFVSSSPYLIFQSTFAINSSLVLPFILLFIFSTLSYFMKKKNRYLFLIFLSAGFILEAELALGFLFVPSLIITILVTRQRKNFFLKTAQKFVVFLGFAIPLIPRILFELKNNFLQMNSLVAFLKNPTATNKITFLGAFNDRLRLCWEMYISLFPNNNWIAAGLTLLIVPFGILSFSFLKKNQRKFFEFVLILFTSLFILSLANKNNFFWQNYFEGISLFFLIILILAFSALRNRLKDITIVLGGLLLFFIISSNVFNVIQMSVKPPKKTGGLIDHVRTVDMLYKLSNDKPFCLRIYTPPVIPYTYMYLFSYQKIFNNKSMPTDKYIQHTCYYIIEHDDYAFRIVKWRKDMIPERAKRIRKITVTRTIRIEVWKKN